MSNISFPVYSILLWQSNGADIIFHSTCFSYSCDYCYVTSENLEMEENITQHNILLIVNLDFLFVKSIHLHKLTDDKIHQ